MRAYVFVWTKVGRGKKLAQQIAKLPGVKLAECCWGWPDVVVFAEVTDAKALESLVVGGIAKVRGVEATETHLVLASKVRVGGRTGGKQSPTMRGEN